MTHARLQRWCLILSAYNYSIAFRLGNDNKNANALSQLPLPDHLSEILLPRDTVLLFQHLETTSVSAIQIKSWTNRDSQLAVVIHYVLNGWHIYGDIEEELSSNKQ